MICENDGLQETQKPGQLTRDKYLILYLILSQAKLFRRAKKVPYCSVLQYLSPRYFSNQVERVLGKSRSPQERDQAHLLHQKRLVIQLSGPTYMISLVIINNIQRQCPTGGPSLHLSFEIFANREHPINSSSHHL